VPALLQAEGACSTDRAALTHWDIRSDNICITSHSVKSIDLPASYPGFWLPSPTSEGSRIH
jgi:hypothetical protein